MSRGSKDAGARVLEMAVMAFRARERAEGVISKAMSEAKVQSKSGGEGKVKEYVI